MVNYRKFEISDELFSGFTFKIDLDMVESLEDIVEYMINATDILYAYIGKRKQSKTHANNPKSLSILKNITTDVHNHYTIYREDYH